MIRNKVDEIDPEAVAVAALGWLAEDPERLERFLAITGLDPRGIRRAAQDSGFLVSVLDYLLQQESLVLGFAASQGWSPETVPRAHNRLQAR